MLRGAIYGLSAAAIWGGMYVVSDVVLDTIPPFTLLALRLLLAVMVLALMLRWRGLPWPARDALLIYAAVGFLGFGISLGAQFVGTALSTAVNGALVTSASPAFIVLFAALILGERLSRLGLFAVLLALLGVIIILDPANADFSSATFSGDLFLALAALTWGLYSVLVRWAQHKIPVDTLMFTQIAFLGGLLLVLPAALVELQSQTIAAVDAGTILGVLYLGIVSTAVAMWLWNRSFALVDASIASLFFFAQPLTGALLGAIFLGQAMTPGLWLGAACICLGVLLALRQERPAQQKA